MLTNLSRTSVVDEECSDLESIPLYHPRGGTIGQRDLSKIIWLVIQRPILLSAFDGVPGLLVAKLDVLPDDIQQLIRAPVNFSELTAELQILNQVGYNLDRAYDWTPARRDSVKTFLQKYLLDLPPSNDSIREVQHVLRRLPVWQLASGEYCAAEDVRMAQEEIHPAIWSWKPGIDIVAYDARLAWMLPESKILSRRSLALEFGSMDMSLMPGGTAYSEWLRLLVALQLEPDAGGLMAWENCLLQQKLTAVRNAEFLWASPSALYNPGEPLFAEVFADEPGLLFLNSSPAIEIAWIDLLGVKVDVDWKAMLHCCSTVHERVMRDSSDVEATRLARLCIDKINLDHNPMQLYQDDIKLFSSFQIVPTLLTDVWWQSYIPRSLQCSTTSMNNAVLRRWAHCVWSQRPIPGVTFCDLLEDIVLQAGFMSASLDTIMDHLRFMMQNVAPRLHINHTSAFLEDLKEIYMTLQMEMMPELTEEMLRPWKNQKIWLNISESTAAALGPEAVQTSHWQAAEDMILDCETHIGGLSPIHDFLSDFVPLLRLMGGHITKNLAPLESVIVKDTLRGELAAMRSQKRSFDMAFQTDSGAILGGHKSIIAAGCPVFHTMFYTDFQQPTKDAPYPLHDIGDDTLQSILHYLYTGSLQLAPVTSSADSAQSSPEETEQETHAGIGDLERMDFQLRCLLHKADYLGIPSLKMLVFDKIVQLKLMAPHTVEGLLADAEAANCPELKKRCEEYIELNRPMIERLKAIAAASEETT